MGKRKGVEANSNMNRNKNGNGSTPISNSASSPSTSMKMPRRGNETADNKIEGGNSSKKMKRGESSNSGAGQSQESIIKEISIDTFPPENVNANVNDQPSSSSSYWTRSRKKAPHPELKELEFTRKGKKDEAVDEEFTEGPINDLPPEMLTKILKNVDNCSLFACRLVSRQWLEISSQILPARTHGVLSFYEDVPKSVPKPHSHGHSSLETAKEISSLLKFVNCMKKCKNIPCSRFFFEFDGPSFFDGEDWIQFLSIFAPSNPNPNLNQKQPTKIKYLSLQCDRIDKRKSLLLFTEKLRDLLLSKIPRLEELGLEFFSSCNDSKNMKLFPRPKTTEPQSTTATIKSSVPVQLPYLKKLEIIATMFSDFPGIVEDLLKAAVNLTRIHTNNCWFQETSPTLVFQFLHSLGKLHLLKKVRTDVDAYFLSLVIKSTTQDQHSNFTLGFKLEELKVYTFERNIRELFHADAINFISNLLESSKDTLEKFEITPFGFLHDLQLPKFTKLKTLKILHGSNNAPLFPPGIRSRSMDIFSAVDDFSFESSVWENAFPQEDSIPIFPSVHTFFIKDAVFVGNAVTQLGLMCPNLKHLVIKKLEGNPAQLNFAQVGRSIWIHLNQLESLEVDLDVNLEAHAFPALDSCFTGISMENCHRLQALMEAEKTRNENSSQVKLSESEEIRELTKREHPSILDMTSFKTLIINPHLRNRPHQGKTFFTTKITWISEEFAFKLMPQLQFNGRSPSTSS